MKFLVDMPLPPSLARWLVEHGHEAEHASSVGLERAADAAIIEYAWRTGQVIITADLDYPRLLALARAERPGLILFRGGKYSEGEVVERLSAALDCISESEIPQSIIVIDRQGVRRRLLPIR
ncbi:MAG TPA: DUF5615 family PIN-like protein [Terriglobia bacterium]|nr:DUF5615 family PIN-like protein [Terriglobia bacterium]